MVYQGSLSHGWSQPVGGERRETTFLALSVTEVIVWRTVVVDGCSVQCLVCDDGKVRGVGSFLSVTIIHRIAIRSSSEAMPLRSSQWTVAS